MVLKSEKSSSPHLVTFPAYIFNFSTFHLSIFLLFCSIFPFSTLFFSSLFPVDQQKFPGQKSLGGSLPPPLRLLRHWVNTTNNNNLYNPKKTQSLELNDLFYCKYVLIITSQYKPKASTFRDYVVQIVIRLLMIDYFNDILILMQIIQKWWLKVEFDRHNQYKCKLTTEC